MNQIGYLVGGEHAAPAATPAPTAVIAEHGAIEVPSVPVPGVTFPATIKTFPGYQVIQSEEGVTSSAAYASDSVARRGV